MVAAMDAVGVDGAILISPFAMYRYDASYARQVYAKHPGRFGLVRPFDPMSASIAEDMAEWAATPGVIGARIMLNVLRRGGVAIPALTPYWTPRARRGFPST